MGKIEATMQKLLNNPKDFLNDALSGFVECYSDVLGFANHPRALAKIGNITGRVGVVSGGGFGHDPAFAGYIGKGMLDAVAVGDLFSPPRSDSFLAAFRAADYGAGVICLIGNYKGDIDSANEAVLAAEKEGIKVLVVISDDDVAESPTDKKRGNTGEVFVWKIVGAAAELGYSLDDMERLAKHAIKRIKTVGVGLASCIIPDIGMPNYVIQRGTMEIGVGHHGQSSMDTCKLKNADDTAEIMLDLVLKNIEIQNGQGIVVMLSGLGNTIKSELHVVGGCICRLLKQRGIKLHRCYIGDFFTSLDMMGVTLSVFCPDDELTKLLDRPAYPVAFGGFNMKI